MSYYVKRYCHISKMFAAGHNGSCNEEKKMTRAKLKIGSISNKGDS